ncbi:MAG: hypothetical protein ABSA17_01410 [Rhabdochlamydiaceae bacterium]
MNVIPSTLPQPAKLICFALSAAAAYAATSNLIEKYAPTFQHKTACSGLLACAVSLPICQSKLLTGCFTALCVAYVMFYNHAQKQSPEVAQPKTILAADGVNQYSAGGSSACTPLACRFIASEDPASPEMLKQLIEGNTYLGNEHLDTEKCIQDTGLIRAENPWAWMAQEPMQATVKNEPMQVTFGQNGVTDLTEAVKTLLGSNEINGAIITANTITIGMRKFGDAVEFFDSHGDASRTHTDKAYGINTAYVIQFQKNQMDQMVEFLTRRFPNIVKNSHIQIWPIQAKETIANSNLAPSASQRTSNPKIPCTFIDDRERLCTNITTILYFDVPTVIHSDPINPQTTTHLLQLKIQDTKELEPLLPANLRDQIFQRCKLSASILVVKQVDNQKWHKLCFHGQLARDKDGKNYPQSRDANLDYSWNAFVGMFGRFGHADEKSPAVVAERQKLHVSRIQTPDNLTLTPIFMPYENLQPSEQQIDEPWPTISAHGTSVYVSGEQPIEGGFTLCCKNGQAHISLVMICNTQTGKEIEEMASSDRINALLAKLKTIKGSEAATAVLENIKL